MAALNPTPQVTPSDRLGLTLFLALFLHGIIILGISFNQQERNAPSAKTLEIILVQTRSETTPEDADYLAQASQEGGGDSEERLRPQDKQSTTLPAKEMGVAPIPLPESRPKPQPTRKAPVVTTTRRTTQQVTQRPKQSETHDKRPSASELRSRSLEIASLTAELNEQKQTYAQIKRHKSITARTREYKYASYLEAWRKKVERIGNLNYPDEARRKKLAGTLLLDVALNPDGSIESINLLRSSGHRVLDDAAIRIVRLAAPYARFPNNIRQETDILHITRTWQFEGSNRFSSR